MPYNIREAKTEDIPRIVEIAYKTWFTTYKTIISQKQMDFMFGETYTPEALWKQMDFLKHRFFLLEEDGMVLGFASISEMVHEEMKTNKVHKLYFLPEMHGKGLGKIMLNFLEELLKNENNEYIILNVNRNNPAYYFYLKVGYQVRETIDIPYGEFVLNDYIMEKKLNR